MHFGWLSVRRPPPERVNVLARLARDPQLRIRDIVDLIWITERAADKSSTRSFNAASERRDEKRCSVRLDPSGSCGEASAQRAEGKRYGRNHQKQDQPAPKIVADRVRGEVGRIALVEVADEAGVVRTSCIHVGHAHPDDEHGQAADKSAPERRESTCA